MCDGGKESSMNPGRLALCLAGRSKQPANKSPVGGRVDAGPRLPGATLGLKQRGALAGLSAE